MKSTAWWLNSFILSFMTVLNIYLPNNDSYGKMEGKSIK